MNRPEQDLQKACVRWFRMQYPKLMLFHIPNGGKRSVIEASIFKAMGVVAGVADLCLLYGGVAHFIEMKAGKGKQSDSQMDFQAYCDSHGFPYMVCDSIDSFMGTINGIVGHKTAKAPIEASTAINP